MVFKKIVLLAVAFLLLFISYSHNIELTNGQELITFDQDKVDFIIDSTNALKLEDAISDLKLAPSLPNRYSIWPQATIWLKINVFNKNATDEKWVIEFKDPHISVLDVYQSNDSSVSKIGNTSGFEIPFTERFYRHKNHVFDLIIPKGSEKTIYVKYQSQHTTSFNFLIRTNRDFTNYALKEYFLLGIFYGTLLILFLYNLVLFFVVRDRSYLLYSMYVFATALYAFTEDGIGFQFVWGDFPLLNKIDKKLAPFVISVFYFLFVQDQLDLKSKSISIYNSMLYYLSVSGVLIAFSILFKIDSDLLRLLPLGVFLFLFMTTFRLSFRQKYTAQLLCYGTGIILFCYLIFVCRQYKVINGSILTVYIFNYGFIIELFILSLANGARLRIIAQETKKAQLETIQLLEEKNKFEKNYNENLERDVKERTLEISQKNAEIKSYHKNLVESINYSKLIQQSMLQESESILQSYFESFVLFKPKDIISGDFYWCHENGRRFTLAVADCTGHGVPGALTGMVCFSSLNSIVNEMKIEEPSMIVKELNRKIYNTLNLNSVEQGEKHGVDIAILTIDLETKRVDFCGANRPFYLVRQGKLYERKGNRINIGDDFVLKNKLSQETIMVQEGDMIYLFSDGFVDQFGGDLNKKFLSAQFRDVLLEISELEVSKQQEILNQKFEDWKGDLMQIDDVLIVGVKF